MQRKHFRAYCEYNLDTQLFKKVLAAQPRSQGLCSNDQGRQRRETVGTRLLAAEVELVLQRDIFLLDIRTKAKQTAITNIPETTFKMKI